MISSEADRHTAPPVFAITILPFAAAVGYVTVAVPFWLAAEGVSLAVVGAISATAMAPHALKVLWAPLIDIGSRRKAWFAAMTAATAALLAILALLSDVPQHLALFTAVATAAQVAGTTAAAAADGLMASTTHPARQGSAAGWRMAGNVGGTGALGAAALWIAARTSVPVAGLALAAVVLASGAAALAIPESQARTGPPATGLARALRGQVAAIARDLWATMRSREGWTGLVICAVPVGAGALTNLFSAIGVSYHASEDVVAAVNGLAGGGVGGLGSLAGGFLADRMNRRLAYALAGGATALSALAMLAAPMTPTTYAWGTLTYNFANGIAFATLAAVVLELVGHGAAVATKYTLFIAVANLASSYMTALDGWASALDDLGTRGALACDAVLTFAGIAVLLAMVAVIRRRRAMLAAPSGGSASHGGG